ncbi:MAG TPA: energy transducer TonB [Rhizomicrobium sp.]
MRENFRQVFASTRLTHSSSNGAPIHLFEQLDPHAKSGRAQIASLLTHSGIVGALALLVFQTHVVRTQLNGGIDVVPGHLLFSPATDIANDHASLGHNGGGGEHNPIPATHGFLAPRSSIQLAPPRLPDNVTHMLAVPVATLDENAPPIVAAVPQLGLPWMANETNSAGPGKNGGIGTGADGGMGDNSGGDAGEGESGTPYSRGMTMPLCVTCPYPLYTDEARKVKMQGAVTLRVLVGADGRAGQIRVARGVGYGLDERAVESVRGWKFAPARDAARKAVPAWVTIEVIFRLF